MEIITTDSKKILGVDSIISQSPVSPWEEHTVWSRFNKDSCLTQLKGDSAGIRIVSEALVYSRLLTLLLKRLAKKSSTDYDSLYSEVGAHLRTHKINDRLECLVYATQIRDYLVHSIQKRQLGSSDKVSTEDDIAIALAFDTAGLYAHLLPILLDIESRRSLLSKRGAEAQCLLDLFQSLTGYKDVPRRVGNRILKALVSLSRESRLYPADLITQEPVEINYRDAEPVDMATFPVYRVSYGGRQICVKVLQLDENLPTTEYLFSIFRREAVIWKQLSHPNLLPFLGLYQNDTRVSLSSPWMSNGGIMDYTKATANCNRIALLHDVTLGLHYLHDMRIIHGDLKPSNILINDSHQACLADFGLSYASKDSRMQGPSAFTGVMGGTIHYEAPELGEDDAEITRETDMYSLGCVIYEVLTGNKPFYELTDPIQVLRAVCLKNQIPSRPSSEKAIQMKLDDEIWRLLEKCWDRAPEKRPSCSETEDFMRRKALRPKRQSSEDEAS